MAIKKSSMVLANLVLLGALIAVWTLKPTAPPERNKDVTYDDKAGKWWDTSLLANIKVSEEWYLDPEIPGNYVPVIGEDETYMVLNDDGTVNRYRKRTKREDGAWVWSDIIEDEDPITFHFVPTDTEGVYETKNEDGLTSLVKFIRNADDTYAFVNVDAYGNILDYDFPRGNSIPDNFVSVDGKNLFAAVNEYGVIIEFWERTIDEMGEPHWQVVTNDYQTPFSGVTSPFDAFDMKNDFNNQLPELTLPPLTVPGQEGTGTGGNLELPDLPDTPGVTGEQRVETETLVEHKIVGGYKTTYETIITYVYNPDGSLAETRKDGPNLIAREKISEADTLTLDEGAIEKTLDAEVTRVSNGRTFKNDVATDVMSELNAERAAAGLTVLHLSSKSDAYKLAKIYASDMAKYDYSGIESPLYGTIADLAQRYGINKTVRVNTWRCSAKSGADINMRLQAITESKIVRMANNIIDAGICITAKEDFYYIAEVFLYE